MTLEEGGLVVRNSRFATVRWANRCLEYSDVVGRWIDILALGGHSDERSDVVEEGKKGLVSDNVYVLRISLTHYYCRIRIGTAFSTKLVHLPLLFCLIGVKW